MIVDVNAHLGPFAFRRLRHQSADSLLGLMDSRGIDRALVSSAAAITHRNTQPANEDLADEARPHPDRLVPFAVLNPSYAGWEDDLSACVDLGFRGIRLYPNWHAYDLTSGPCLDLVDRATEMGMIISVAIRVEDPRQQSWLVDVPDVPLDQVASLVAARPGARFHLVNGRGYVGSPLGRKDGGLPDNYRIDIARLDVLLRDEIEALLAALGTDRLLFGTGIPFQYPDPTFAKLDALGPTPEVREKLLGRNAMEWIDRA